MSATTRERRPAAPETTRVVDADRRRARATEELLGALAPALGLDVGSLRVRADGEAAARTRARGARALAAGGTIWVDPGRYDPLSADGRALLAHEAAHVAQRAETRTRPDRRSPSLRDSEREAAAVAAAVREGRIPPLPLATLPAGAVAADTGVAVAEPPAAQQDQTRPDPLETYRGWDRELEALVAAVRQVHARQLAQIEDRLDGLWISDGDVEDVLRVLEPLPYEQAAAIVRALPDVMRVDLADNLSPWYRSRFRTGSLAVYAGLQPAELRALGTGAFEGLPLASLLPEERFLAIVVLLGLSHETRKRLLADSDLGAGIAGLIEGPAPDAARLARERADRRAALDKRRAAEAEAAGPAQDRIARLQRWLRRPTATEARLALEELAGLLPAAPAVQPAEPAETRPAEAAEPPAPAEPAEFRVVVEALEQTGAVDRMIRALLEVYRTTPGRLRDAFRAVVGKRAPDANARLARDLLGTGVFGWISDEEARLAYDIVRALPLDARERLLRSDEGVWLERLESNLPADVLARADYVDLAVVTDEDAARSLWADELPTGPAQVLRRILDVLDRGAGTGAASVVLDELLAVAPEVRQAVVGRLDTLGRFDAVLDHLGDHVLLAEDRRADVAAVLAARDARHLERHVRRLLSTNLLDWAVTSREAYLAFLMWRALPPADRERFGRLDEIVGELSAEMRASAGLHVVTSQDAATQRNDVRERLADERTWSPEHAPELRALVGVAVALGERRWAFEQSQLRRAWEDATLEPIVEHFELYNPKAGRETFVPAREEKGGILEDFGLFTVIRAIGRAGWFVISQGFKGTLYVDPWAGRAGIRTFSLLDLQQAAGGDLGGAVLSPESEPEETVRTNELTVTWDDKAGTLDVALPALELASIAHMASSWTLRTGPVSARGIKVHADFANRDLAYPRNADIGVDDVSIADILASDATGLAAVTRAHLGGFGAHGDLATLAPSATRSHVPGLMLVPIFEPIIETLRLLTRAAAVVNARSGALLQGMRAELASFEIEGIVLPGDRQVASVAVAGIKLGWGATRAQYLRLKIESLDKRKAAAADDDERKRLTEELESAKRELAEFEPAEQELIALLRRRRQDPGSMTDDDHRRLLELQQQGPGGVVVETGPITIRGVGGSVAAREIAVDRVIGHGETVAATLAVLTDEAVLRRFTREGPAQEDPLAWAGELDLGNVSAVDIVYEDEIPPVDDLVREREQLATDATKLERQPQILARVTARIAALDATIQRRTELDELSALKDPTREQLARRRELRTALARQFGISVERVQAADARITGRAETGTTELSARSLEVTKVESDAYAVEQARGTGVRLGYSTASGAMSFGADTLHVGGVRADELGSTVAGIDMTGVEGSAKEIKDGYRIEGLVVASMQLGKIDWGTTTKRITSERPVTVNGVTATLEARWTGEGADAESIYRIERLDIEQIVIPSPGSTPGLVYEDLASGLRVELLAGALRGVWADDFTIRMGKTTTFKAAPDKASIGFERFDALSFAAGFANSFQVRGVLTSPEPAAGESALGITFAGTDAYAFDLRDLTLTRGVLTTPDGSVRILRLPMSGVVTYASRGAESDIGLQNFTVPDLVLGAIRWSFKGGLLRTRGRSVLRGITATAGVRLDAAGLAGATVTDVRIAEIAAEDLTFTKGPLEVRVNQPAAPGRPALDVKDVHIQGLEYERAAGVTSGAIDVGPAAAGLEAQFAGALAKGTLSADAISVRFFPGNRIAAGAEGIDVAGDLTTGSGTAGLQVSDIDASVAVEPGRVRIKAHGAKPSAANLALPPIRLPALDFTVKGVHLQLLSGGRIDVNSLDTGITLDLGSGDKEPAVKRVTLDTLDLSAVEVRRLLVEDPTLFRVELQDPASPAVVKGVHIVGLAIDFDLANTPSLAGYSTIHADEIALDWVDAMVNVDQVTKRYLAPPPGTPPTPFNPASLSPFAAAMNSLNGHVALNVSCPTFLQAPGGWYRIDDPSTVNAPVRVVIRRGEVNLTQVIETVGWGLHNGFLFELRNNGSQLVMVLDAGALGRRVPFVRRSSPTASLRTDVAWWNLTAAELARLQAPDVDLDGGRVPLDLFGLAQVQSPLLSGPPSPAGGHTIWRLRFRTDQLEFNNIDAQLSTVNDKALPIALGIGTVTLAPFALDRMRITGNLPGLAPLELGVEGLDVQSIDLALPYGLGQLTSDQLLLSGLTDGRLNFLGGDPQIFKARIARLRWRNITMTGTPAP